MAVIIQEGKMFGLSLSRLRLHGLAHTVDFPKRGKDVSAWFWSNPVIRGLLIAYSSCCLSKVTRP